MNLEEIILEHTKYVPVRGEKVFSASMHSNTVLQNYLIIKSRDDDSENIDDGIGQNTLGSIFHLGLEKMLNEAGNCVTEYPIKHKIGDWIISATCDLVLTKGISWEISDHKLTKIYAGTIFKKNPKNSGYFWQLQQQAYLFGIKNQTKNKDIEINLYLNMFYKDANMMKGEPSFERIKVEELDESEFIAELEFKLNDLDFHLSRNITPPKCDDLWWRKKGKISIPTRCEFYCSSKAVCPYYNNTDTDTKASILDF